MQRPTREDDVVAGLSPVVGGPSGDHAGRHPWWTPTRVVLLLVAVTCVLGMIQKAPCQLSDWQGGNRYELMCYSDLPYLYTGRGLHELWWPYTDAAEVRSEYPAMEYPVGIAYAAYGAAWLTQLLGGLPDLEQRRASDGRNLWSDPQIVTEITWFVAVNAVLLSLAAIVAGWFLTRVNPGRPWDAAGFAAAPVLALTAFINWDLYAVALLAGALWAWARDRPVLTGVLIGLGTATKLYPLFLLGGVLVICLRRRQWAALGTCSGAAAVAWVLANLPALLTGPQSWQRFWVFNSERGAGLGSLWLVVQQASDEVVSVSTINTWSLLLFGGWCVAVLVLGLAAPKTPRLAQLALLVVAGFLLVNKVYSPQYVLWLLPLAALAVPRWRDLLIWQSGEVLYFAAVWWYLGGWLTTIGGEESPAYWVAIGIRVVAQLYLVGMVVRDVLRPEHDPVSRGEPGLPAERPTDPAAVPPGTSGGHPGRSPAGRTG